MVARTTFIHAADLHLGSPLRSLGAKDPSLAEALKGAVSCAFDRLIDEAVARKVDFVLIAGDIFDSEEPAYADMMRFVEGMERLDGAGIQVFAVTGNHDRCGAWERGLAQLPSNVRVFCRPDVEYGLVEKDGCVLAAIVARGYCEDAPDRVLERMGADAVFRTCGEGVPFAIGMLHTGLDIDRRVSPVSPQVLQATNLDYWALGHIHRRTCDNAADPRIVFSGCTQGRDVGEPGDCGCNLVRLEEGAPNRVEFVPLSAIAWERLRIDVSGAFDVNGIEREIARTLRARARGLSSNLLLARVVLEGASGLRGILLERDVLDDLRVRLNEGHEGYACDGIECRVGVPIDRKALLEQGMFPAALLSSVDGMKDDHGLLRDVVSSGFREKGLATPPISDAELDAMCDGAEGMLLSMLLGGSHAR